MDISNFAVSPNVYKLTFVLAAFAPQDLSQNTAHKAVQKAFYARANFESLPVYVGSNGSYVASGEDLSLVIAYLAANSSGKTQSVARDMLDRFGVDFTVEEGRIVMAARAQEEDEEEEFEADIQVVDRVQKVIEVDTSHLRPIELLGCNRPVTSYLDSDGKHWLYRRELIMALKECSVDVARNDMTRCSVELPFVYLKIRGRKGAAIQFCDEMGYSYHAMTAGPKAFSFFQANSKLFRRYIGGDTTLKDEVDKIDAHHRQNEASGVTDQTTFFRKEVKREAPPPVLEDVEENRALRLARMRAERYELEAKCLAIEADKLTIMERSQSRAREEIAKSRENTTASLKKVSEFQEFLDDAEANKKFDARFLAMMRSLTIADSPTNYEVGALVKDFNDLRGVLTGHGPSFAGPKTTIFGKICAFELEEKTGAKPDKKLTTLAATNQTNQVNAYDKSEWDWIRLYWKAYNYLGCPTFLEWKDLVVDIRQENGDLNWPSDLEQFVKGDGDLRKYCTSSGKKKPTLLTKWLRQ